VSGADRAVAGPHGPWRIFAAIAATVAFPRRPVNAHTRCQRIAHRPFALGVEFWPAEWLAALGAPSRTLAMPAAMRS